MKKIIYNIQQLTEKSSKLFRMLPLILGVNINVMINLLLCGIHKLGQGHFMIQEYKFHEERCALYRR